MGLFSSSYKMKDPIFLKEDSASEVALLKLQELAQITLPPVKHQIEQDIKFINSGIYGEKNIIYELKNSHMPMVVLHDLFLSDDDLTAQIDFLIITRQCNYIVECKNMLGNIEITNTGDFIRTVQYNGKFLKEGIYSPITQNTRHIALIKQIRSKVKRGGFAQRAFETSFPHVYKSVVVLANEKTILNNKFAKKEIKDQVIRADQLIAYINRVNKMSEIEFSSDNDMMGLGEFFLDCHTQNPIDYTVKYQLDTTSNTPTPNFHTPEYTTTPAATPTSSPETTPSYTPESIYKHTYTPNTSYNKQNYSTLITRDQLIQKLKEFRLKKSRQENIPPYYIFNDEQLNDLLNKMPKTTDKLKYVSGFGDIKVKKYGYDIICLIKQHSP